MRERGKTGQVGRASLARFVAASAALLLVCNIGAAQAQAQKYPVRTVKLVSPFPPGGGVDIVGRLVANSMSQRLGQQVVLENIGGASGTIGTNAVVRAAADGYTALFAPPTPITIVENFQSKLPYDSAATSSRRRSWAAIPDCS